MNSFHAHAASHARAASSSDVSAFATASRSAEEQHRKLFEEFCTRKYAAARNKTISQLEAGSEFTESCDAGGGGQIRWISFAGENFREFNVLWRFAKVLSAKIYFQAIRTPPPAIL